LAKVIPTELLSKKYGRFAHCFTQIFAPSMELSFFDRIDITIDFDLKLFTIYNQRSIKFNTRNFFCYYE
jgi:hypothetical protein